MIRLADLLRRLPFCVPVAIFAGITMVSNADALDRIYEKSGESISGDVMQTSSQGIQLKRAGNTQNILAGDILKILHEGDPAPLTRGREFALDGQYQQALTELQNVNFSSLKREIVKADAAYYIAMCEAKLALAGKEPKDQAQKKLLSFAGTYRDSWHFYDAAKLLGDLALAQNDATNALKYYQSLEKAPSTDSKVLSVYLQGLVQLNKGDLNAALAEFDKVINLKAQTTETTRLQILAKAGKAMTIAANGKADEGLELVNELIRDINPADVEMAARVYNAQGASYEASGDNEGAIMAYLHTHLMFSAQPDAHAEALKRLVELWPLVGKPDRAAAARQELQQRYPGF